MAFEIDEEDIFPGLLLRGAGLDLAQTHLEFFEGLQDAKQCAGLVLRMNEHTGLIIARGCGALPGQDQESCTVMILILDAGMHYFQIINCCGEEAGNSGNPTVVLRL